MQVQFTREELLQSHDYARPNVIGSTTMHGGFDESGTYIPPRIKGRSIAIANWTRALRDRGGDLLAADSSLLSGPRCPNVEQQCLLIREGMSRVFWNTLTITGKIEGRGRMLATMPLPDLQSYIDEDISNMAIGHLSKGLMYAHGIDEGGEPEKQIGGHDVMWFVARDLAFGADAWPDAEPPERISRPESGERKMPQIAPELEALLAFLMNLLLIEFRAEIGFAATQQTLRAEGLFVDRRDDAELAAEIVERIREDEKIHVESLRLYLGELREVRLHKTDGGRIFGSTLIDPYWNDLVAWATGGQSLLAARQVYEAILEHIGGMTESKRVRKEFDELMDDGVLEAEAA